MAFLYISSISSKGMIVRNSSFRVQSRRRTLIPLLLALKSAIYTSASNINTSQTYNYPKSSSSFSSNPTAFCQSNPFTQSQAKPPTSIISKVRYQQCLTMSTSARLWSDSHEGIQRCIPPLSSKSYKGSSGRVGVLGGSARYTGAPYYAAMASLKAGADLAFVFCAEEAAIPIKCYSPELMVAPVYNAKEFDNALLLDGDDGENARTRLVDKMVSEVVDLFNRMHVLVIGPGLGRCPLVFEATAKIIRAAKVQNLPLVIDADGLFLLTQEPYRNILLGYEHVVLTPNVVEMKRLIEMVDDDESNGGSNDSVETLSKVILGNILVRKGKHDFISSIIQSSEEASVLNEIKMECKEEGGLKRSGGIGDVLSGTMGAFVAWHYILSKGKDSLQQKDDLILSCWCACCLTKKATRSAFEKKRRSMTAPDILEEVGVVFDKMTRIAGDEVDETI